jgi:hypothetical protein
MFTGASLVKPIPFQPYDPSMGKDIFEKLIPMKAHESSSLYRYTSYCCVLSNIYKVIIYRPHVLYTR